MVNQINSADRSQPVFSNDKKTAEQQKSIQKDETGVVLELGSSTEKRATYSKPVAGRNSEEINRLWNETKKTVESLRSIVVRLVVSQGKKLENVLSGRDKIFVDDKARAEAEKLLAEDGELGVKAVSTRIVDFAKALSGGDKSKLAELRAGIEKGFRQAETAFGGKLPDICKATYDEVMKQLDEWENEE
jgi:phosphoenolpyruvate-protein kinase (PTS system EI component)